MNIGSNREISIKDTVIMIGNLMGEEIEIVEDEERLRPENSEVFRLQCDNRLIKDLVGFEPHTSLEDGLARTIDWFTQEKNLQKYKSHIYNV